MSKRGKGRPGKATAQQPCALGGIGQEMEVKPTRSLNAPSCISERYMSLGERFFMYFLLPQNKPQS